MSKLLCRVVLSFALHAFSLDLTAQQYGQLVQTPLLLHPAYAGRERFATSLVAHHVGKKDVYITDISKSHYTKKCTDMVLSCDRKMKNSAWAWGAFLVQHVHESSYSFEKDTSKILLNDSITNQLNFNGHSLSVFAGKTWSGESGRYLWTKSFGADLMQFRSEDYGYVRYENFRWPAAASVAPTQYISSYTEQITNYSPMVWAALAVRSKRVMLGAKLGIGQDVVSYFRDNLVYHAPYGRSFHQVYRHTGRYTFATCSFAAEASFPKKAEATFRFRPVVKFRVRYGEIQNPLRLPRGYGYDAFETFHMSLNFHWKRVLFGAGASDDYGNFYAGYSFLHLQVIAGYAPGNYSLGVSYRL